MSITENSPIDSRDNQQRHRDRVSVPQDQMVAVPAPCLNRYVVVVRDAGKDHGNPSEFFQVWAESIEDAHHGVTSMLRNMRDDWMSRIVAVHDLGERTFL